MWGIEQGHIRGTMLVFAGMTGKLWEKNPGQYLKQGAPNTTQKHHCMSQLV